MRRFAWILAVCGLVGSALLVHAQGGKDTLSVDLPGEPATLDPHVQWDTDSYHVYRNIFDNLVTRNPDGKIVPQIAKAWRYESDTVMVLDIRTDVKFHDGTPLTVDDVVWSVQRITDPAFKSPQLSQFNSIVKAEAVGPDTRATDHLVAVSGAPGPARQAEHRASRVRPEGRGTRSSTSSRWEAVPTGSSAGKRACASPWPRTTATGAAGRPSRLSRSRWCRIRRPVSPT